MAGYAFHSLLRAERAHTQLRMGRSQSKFWLRCTLLLWLVIFTVTEAWLLGPEGRKYAPYWILSSLVAGFGGRIAWLSVPYINGRWYPAANVVYELNRVVYHQPLSAWVADVFWPSLLLTVVVMVLVWLRVTWPSAADRAGEAHVRGVQLLTRKQLRQRLLRATNGGVIAFGRYYWPQRLCGDGVSVAGVELPRQMELSHVAISGATGAGKTTVLRSLLRQIARRGEVAIVVDPEQDFVQEFYRPERGDVLLNPFDARCPVWSPWLEMEGPGDAEALAKSLLPDPAKNEGAELYFRRSARQVLVTLLRKLTSHNPHEIREVLFGDEKALTKLVAGTPAASLLDSGAPGQRSGIISTLQLAVEAFHVLPLATDRSRRPTWSVRQWEQERQGWVFLTYQNQHKEIALPLVSLWLDTLIRRLLDTDLARAERERVWIVIDELATLQRQQHLEDLLMRGRKHGVSAVVGFQALTQLRGIYGFNEAATMLAAPSTKLLLRSGEPVTARWCSDAIGNREVIRPQESETAGPADTRDSFGHIYQRREESAVLTSEIQQLPNLRGYLCLAGLGVARVAIEPLARVVRHPGFVPRTEVVPTPTDPPVNPSSAATAPPEDPTRAPSQVETRPAKPSARPRPSPSRSDSSDPPRGKRRA